MPNTPARRKVSQRDLQRAAFPETADIETSSDGYAQRFSGDVGAWFLEVQSRAVKQAILAALTDPAGHSLLDVGGGHGQLVPTALNLRMKITVVGSSDGAPLPLRGFVNNGHVTYSSGNLVDLPYPDKSFDVVTCVRFLSHCSLWERCIAELCRVARAAVIIDYPTKRSLNILTPLLFSTKKKIEGNTRQYRIFSEKEIASTFTANNYFPSQRRAQFLAPMGLYRLVGSRGFAASTEGLFRKLSLTDLVGSPVIGSFSPPVHPPSDAA